MLATRVGYIGPNSNPGGFMFELFSRCANLVGTRLTAQSWLPIAFAKKTVQICFLAASVSLVLPADEAAAQLKRRRMPSGKSDARTRDEAVKGIPLHMLSAADRDQVSAVLENLTLFRRMPIQATRCDPELYTYVVNHPEILANVWQIMGVDDIVLEQTGRETYRAFDEGKSEGSIEFLFRNHDTHVILARGSYDGPLFAKPVTGTCLLVMKSAFQREPDGSYYVTSRLDAFLSLEHAGAEFLAKTFQPFVVKVADQNFLATGSFMASLSGAAESHPEAVLRVVQRLDHVHPDVRRQFVGITTDVSRRAQERMILQAGGYQPRPLGTPSRR